MKTAIDLAELFFSYGIDIIIVISILGITQGIKKYLKVKKKTAFIVLISSGLCIGIAKIILNDVSESLYLTALFGYAGITSLLYVAIDIFLPAIKEKYFPSTKRINGNENK